MRKCLLGLAFIAIGASPAFAKPVVYNWNGFYVGAHAGGVWGDVNVTDDITDGVPPGPFRYSVSGFFGGGTAGYNFEIDNIVFGIEGDLEFIDPNGRELIPSSDPAFHHHAQYRPLWRCHRPGRRGLCRCARLRERWVGLL